MDSVPSIPPFVSGAVRGQIQLTVSSVEWFDSGVPEAPIYFLVQWWGQKTWTPLLKSSERSEAAFRIRCGLRQFCAYLSDMRCLTLRCTRNQEKQAFARVNIPDIVSLAEKRLIAKKFPIVSIHSGKCLGQVMTTIRMHLDGEGSDNGIHAQESLKTDEAEEAGQDLLSVLLDKGQRLRKAMIVSSMMEPSSNGGVSLPQLRSSSPDFSPPVKDLLMENADVNADLEMRSSNVSESDLNSNLSESDDPFHDESLLADLFYQRTKEKVQKDSRSSDEDESSSESTQIETNLPVVIVKETVADDLMDPTVNANDGHQDDNWDPTAQFDGEFMTILGRVDMARMKVNRFVFSPSSAIPKDNSTIFVEYQFPICVSLIQRKGESSSGLEVIRLMAKKCQKGVVSFHHHSVFPVLFQKQTIDKWLASSIYFHVFSRVKGMQKPISLGQGSFPLKSVLLADYLQTSSVIAIVTNGSLSGYLEISFELSSKNGRFQDANAVAWRSRLASRAKERKKKGLAMSGGLKRASCTTSSVFSTDTIASSTESVPSGGTKAKGIISLNILLCIPEGRELCGESVKKNFYIVCRSTIWTDPMRSRVCWGSENPLFRLRQICPVVLNSQFVWSLRDGLVIIEIWNRRSSGQDQLVGLLKLSLNHFYATCRDPELMQVFLKAKYPLIAVDGWCPVVNPLTGQEAGDLNVLLAIGSYEQVRYLEIQRSKEISQSVGTEKTDDENATHPKAERFSGNGSYVLHTFSVSLSTLSSTASASTSIWGEADCFVQYSFPSESSRQGVETADFPLTPHRTACLLCLPEVRINSSFDHAFHLPRADSLQAKIQRSFTRRQSSHRANVVFEMWKRFYVPNIRDQIVAKAVLPLTKVLALVTMHKGETGSSGQHHVLSLNSVESLKAGAFEEVGSLSLSVSYGRRLLDRETTEKEDTSLLEDEEGEQKVLISGGEESPLDDTSLETSTVDVPSTPSAPPPPPHHQDDHSSFFAVVGVMGALHIVPALTEAGEGLLVQCCCSSDADTALRTQVRPLAESVEWNESFRASLPLALIKSDNHALIFNVIQVNSNAGKEIIVGSAAVQLTAIAAGLSEICGWYTVTDRAGCDRGQLLVSIRTEDPAAILKANSWFGQKVADDVLIGEPSSVFDQLRRQMADLDDLQKRLVLSRRQPEDDATERPNSPRECVSSVETDELDENKKETPADDDSEWVRSLGTSPVVVELIEEDSVRSSLSLSVEDLTDVSSLGESAGNALNGDTGLHTEDQPAETELMSERDDGEQLALPLYSEQYESDNATEDISNEIAVKLQTEEGADGNHADDDLPGSDSKVSIQSYNSEADPVQCGIEEERLESLEDAEVSAVDNHSKATPLFFMSTSQLEENMRRLKSRISDLTYELEKTCRGEESETQRRQPLFHSHGPLAEAFDRMKLRTPLTKATVSKKSLQEVDRLTQIFQSQTIPN